MAYLVKQDTSDRVYWSEEEWDQLADIVWPMRLADTTSALVGLVKKAQEQFPKDRRRNIKTIQQLGPLTTRMQAKVRDTLNCLEQVQRLRDKVDTLVKERKTRDEWVESLTDRDLIYLFSDRLPRIIGELLANYKKVDQVPAPVQGQAQYTVERKPKVVVYNLLPRQLEVLKDKVPEAVIIIGNPATMPSGDLVIFWTDFAAHKYWDKMPNTVKPYTGGLKGLADMIREELGLES